MSKDEIKKEIERLKKEKEHPTGCECEVFSRVVGYLRPVQNWNKGKKEEYTLRANFKVG